MRKANKNKEAIRAGLGKTKQQIQSVQQQIILSRLQLGIAHNNSKGEKL